ncbi:MAG: hypothetical protein PUC59_02575, partial [Firmicutes bacterium]|nr:hypothetical protein [Bacillota bacterium]
YLAKWIARQTLGRKALSGGYLFLESDPGMEKSRLLRAASRGEIDCLIDLFLIYFDARRPLYCCCRDFFNTILQAVHSFLPRYQAESRDVSVLCATLLEALHSRNPQRRILILIDHLHDAPPELFSLLPAAGTLPEGIFFLLSFDRGARQKEAFERRFQKITPAASWVLTRDEFSNTLLMKRSISRDMLHLNFKHRLTDGDMLVEHAMTLTRGDWYGCTLLNEMLQNRKNAAFLQEISQVDDLAAVYFRELRSQLGEMDFVRVVTMLAALLVCGSPVRPEYLPGLSGIEPKYLALLCRRRGLVTAFLQDGVLMLEPASERLYYILAQEFPESLQAMAGRLWDAACGELRLRLPKGGTALVFTLFFPAMLRSGTPEQQQAVFGSETLSSVRIAVGKALETGKLSNAEAEEVWKAEIDAARRTQNTAGMAEGLTQLCILHRRTENFTAAVHDMDELLKVSKGSGAGPLLFARLHQQRAELLLKADRFRAALEGFGKAITYAERAEASEERTVFLASLLRRRGEIEKQHKLYLPMMDDLNRSAELLRLLGDAACGELALTLLLRGRAWILRGDGDAALRDFSDAVVLASGAGEKYVPALRDLYRERGHALFALNEPRKAAASFTNAAAITKRTDGDPYALAQLYADRAQAHEADNDTEHALADRSECIAVLSAPKLTGPHCAAKLAEAFLLRAQLYGRLEKYAEAIRDCSDGIRRLEPFLDGKDKAAALLCISIYRQRMDACSKTGDDAQIAEDRRRIAQLKILLA